ncbi:hypothetical protein [Streptomyces sp. NPDC088766]|uniref:hypothetical protein n=1 Tax=Streptomyces sp. NPDC088766 TaxID=3365893 RepID=UPI003825B614
MHETTQAQAGDNTPRAFGWCSWHSGYAEGIRLINFQEQGSGPGGGAFACGPCIETHGLIPFADQPCTPAS